MDQTEKGWFIAYIDRDPETIARQEAAQKKEKQELDDEERTQRFIQRQVEKASELNARVRWLGSMISDCFQVFQSKL